MAELAAVNFRPATKEDVPALLWLIQLLAEDEKEPHALKIGKEELIRDGFGEECYFKVILVESNSPVANTNLPVANANPPVSTSSALPSASMEKNERLVGYALYFFNYSTWQGRVLYLEDLFIRTEYRSKGYGTALMKEVAKVAKEKDCSRMIWQVLDWNTRAMELYERVGGQCEREWLTLRMYRPKIAEFADSA